MIAQTTQTDVFAAAGGAGGSSKVFSVAHVYLYSVQLKSTGGAGTATIQASVDGVDFVTISATSVAYSDGVSLLINQTDVGYSFIKVNAVGAGSIAVSVSLKG